MEKQVAVPKVPKSEKPSKKGKESESEADWIASCILKNPYLPEGTRKEEIRKWSDEMYKLFKGRNATFVELLCLASLLENNPNVKELLSIRKEDYENAESLLKSLMNKKPKPIMVVNFAYGIATIGKEKASALYEQAGVLYFGRYTKKLLEEAHLNMSRKSRKPLLVVAFGQSDFIGAFYGEGKELERLTKHYKVVLCEASTEDELYSKLKSFSGQHGKIDTLIIGGHGEETSIKLGDRKEKEMIDLTDSKEIRALRGVFVEEPTVVLLSCSTGAENIGGIGHLISKELGCHLFAPKEITNKTTYILDPNGKIIGVKYDVPRREFIKGVPLKNN